MAAAAGTAKACYGAGVNRTTQAGRAKMRTAALKATHGGTTRASPEIVFGALPGAWRADPEAVEIIGPLLELAKRVRHNTLDIDAWSDAWAGRGQPGTPTGQIKLAMEKSNLSGTAFDWKHNTMEWRVALEGEKATEDWLLNLWKLNEAKVLAIRRPKYYGHLKKGWDATLITKGIAACDTANKGAFKSLMSGDTYTDSLASKFGKGDGKCKICGVPDAKVWHTLWECPGKEGNWETLRDKILGPGGLTLLTNTLSEMEMTTMVWSVGFPSENLSRNRLAASADAFTHLGEIWEAGEVFMDGACTHEKDPQLASAAWGVTDGDRTVSGLVLGWQAAMRGEVHGIIAAAWHTRERGLIWTDNRTIEQTVARGRTQRMESQPPCNFVAHPVGHPETNGGCEMDQGTRHFETGSKRRQDTVSVGKLPESGRVGEGGQ